MEPVVERCELTIKEGQEAAFIDGFRKVKRIAVHAAVYRDQARGFLRRFTRQDSRSEALVSHARRS